MAGSRNTYSFPTLERKEILKCLAQIGVTDLSEENLVKPSREIIWPLYENLVQYLVGIPRNELQQPVLGALDCVRHQELYADSVGTLASFRAISKLMHAAGVDDFGTRDIFRPEPARTVHALSAVINFAYFRAERELPDTETELVDRIQQLEETRIQLQNAIAQNEAERKAEEPQVQKLSVEAKELEQKIYALNKQQAVLQSDIRGIKEELNKLTEKIVSEKASVAQMKQEGFQLRTQIVQSPDKLRKMLEDRRAAVQNAEAEVESARQSVVKWKHKYEAYTKAKRKVQKCLDMMDSLDKQAALQKKMVKDSKEMKMKLKENEEKHSVISAQLEKLKIEGQHFHNLLEKLDSSFDVKCQEADKELEDFRLQNAPLIDQLDKQEEQIARKQDEVEMITSNLNEARSKKEAGLKALHDEVELIQNEVLRYNEDLMRVIESSDGRFIQ
ncbi:probable kinetochore protein NUF2 isoform X2 [Selaginella moellendorffii]|uniref:probable kinetochore protein NUF2 isoform X2 n=1 Tax=Selaginella moellendorffii TaxID=88036 RepID=UPI000D1CFBD2|nr:probable kinetochore protein NUF2 isoform X2 [Selaginella moellendorffii]|eukprot:XP_024522330.1 probable kinetochore protein NUF2 isoform X2 [Selaginella moellendorffii]